MDTDPKLNPDSFPRWMLFSAQQMPEGWLMLPKRTMMTGEREQIVTSRVCTKCKDEKPFSAFWVLKSGAYDSWCKNCRNFVKRERTKRNRNKK
jgi:hypothetical protein